MSFPDTCLLAGLLTPQEVMSSGSPAMTADGPIPRVMSPCPRSLSRTATSTKRVKLFSVWGMADPFGIDANDLPLYRMLQCYRETLQTTLVCNTPSAQPHVTLWVAIQKMRKTLPGDYVLKPGTAEYENMNRLCILKTCVPSCPTSGPHAHCDKSIRRRRQYHFISLVLVALAPLLFF